MSLLNFSKGSAPFFSLAGLPLALIITFLLMWPLAVTGNLSGFQDSNSYLKGGDAIWREVSTITIPLNQKNTLQEDASSVLSTQKNGPSLDDTAKLYGRSITYAAILGGVVRTAGPLTMVFLQALMISLAMLALVNQSAMKQPMLVVVGLLMLLCMSQVAWLSVSLMPDVLGAIVIVFAAVLVSRFEDFSRRQKIGISLLAAYAVSSHYGNIPLAVATVSAALLLRFLKQRPHNKLTSQTYSVTAAALFVVISAPLLNMTASYLVLGESSMTPLRPPVVLARSLEDGPARWYLEEQCTTEDNDFCQAFDNGVPDNHFDFLWRETEPEAMQSAREYEWKIVVSAALEYPLEQLAAIIKNTGKQLILVDETANSMSWNGKIFEVDYKKTATSEVRKIAESAMVLITILSSIYLVSLSLLGRLTQSQAHILVVVIFGLIINALIFGALSAPAERYQARVAWLIPFLMVIFLAENHSTNPKQETRI